LVNGWKGSKGNPKRVVRSAASLIGEFSGFFADHWRPRSEAAFVTSWQRGS
jgi:hypothetical protein